MMYRLTILSSLMGITVHNWTKGDGVIRWFICDGMWLADSIENVVSYTGVLTTF